MFKKKKRLERVRFSMLFFWGCKNNTAGGEKGREVFKRPGEKSHKP